MKLLENLGANKEEEFVNGELDEGVSILYADDNTDNIIALDCNMLKKRYSVRPTCQQVGSGITTLCAVGKKQVDDCVRSWTVQGR